MSLLRRSQERAEERLREIERGNIPHARNPERLKAILRARAEGQTLTEIARQYNISKQAVSQIIVGTRPTGLDEYAGIRQDRWKEARLPRCPCGLYSRMQAGRVGHECVVADLLARKRKELLCMLTPNGCTAVFRDNQQQPELQRPWLELFAEFLESRGEDPTACSVIMPDGQEARFFRASENRWNWEFR